MLNKSIIGAIVALSLGIVQPVNTSAVETYDKITVDETGDIILSSDHAETDGISTIQINLQVEPEADAEISVVFAPEIDIKVSEYRYDTATNLLNIYMSDSQPLFSDSQFLNVGTVSVTDTDGNAVPYTITQTEDSLKYIYDNAVIDVEADIDIVTTTTTTTEELVTTTTTTTTTSDTETDTETTTTTSSETTTSTSMTLTSVDMTTVSRTSTTSATTSTTSTTSATTTSTTTTTTTTTETTTAKPVTTKTTTTSKNIASDDELCEWSIKNYNDINGIMPDSAE
ncbi:MAG: hypothetical protein K2G36_04045, partial [Ruminococcus sp.]|nr:hypothetical protein [Ruminococcus sp.]